MIGAVLGYLPPHGQQQVGCLHMIGAVPGYLPPHGQQQVGCLHMIGAVPGYLPSKLSTTGGCLHSKQIRGSSPGKVPGNNSPTIAIERLPLYLYGHGMCRDCVHRAELIVVVSGVGVVGYQITFPQKQSPTQLATQTLFSFGNQSGSLVWYRL